MISVLLADDHAVVRQGLGALLELEKDLRIVGESGDGIDTVRLVEKIEPDVVVIDVAMPGLNGIDVTREVKKRRPRTGVVVLSMHADESYVTEALRSGASAYVLKGSPASDLVEAIRAAHEGRTFLGPPLSQLAIDAYAERARQASGDTYDELTSREREVFQLAAEGKTNAEIAARLFISTRTVETHRANLMRKLGLRSSSDLLRYAIRRGLVHP